MYTERITLVQHLSIIDECDGCGEWVRLDQPEEVFIGGECDDCGYYTTRYQPGMEPK